MDPLFRANTHRASRRPRHVAILWMLAAVAGSIVVGAAGGQAQDLPPGGTFVDEDLSTHEGYIEAIAAIGVTLGCDYQLYCPSAEVSREQMASFLARALDLPPSVTDHFTDDDNSPHEANINRLADAGITLGCGGDNYCPYSSVTRAEMASFLARAFKLGGGTTDHFTDDDGNPHEANINKVADAGITLGCGGDSYCPDNAVKRDQMASFIGRGMGLAETKPPYPVRTLVGKFYQWEPDRDDIRRYEVDDVYYYPRQFATGFLVGDDAEDDLVTNANNYAGWDVLLPASRWSDRRDSQFFNFFLTRPARVALVWREKYDAKPAWLSSWALSGTVSIDGDVLNVYEKTFGYGWQSLAGPTPDSESSRVYTVLLAEANGNPTAAPPVPAGQEEPVPNRLCPLWVHDSYTTVAWDGETYGTWHPQIDPVYWCYFGHEHGSDPKTIPGAPFVGYQYVADKVPQDEPDMGFKETIFRTTGGSYVRFIDHVSTASARRVCARLHTVYVMVYDAAGNEVFRTGFKADFGVSVATDRDGDPPITPTNCGYDMADLAASISNKFKKRIRTTADSGNYEQWKSAETVEAANLGMVFNHEFDIRDPFTFCADLTCDSVVFHDPDRGQTSTRRQMDNIRGGEGFVFNSALALRTGTFYTDPYGKALVDAGADNATEHYIQPGFYMNLAGVLSDPGNCAAIDPWTMFYSCTDPSVGEVNISNSLDPAGWMAKLAAESG